MMIKAGRTPSAHSNPFIIINSFTFSWKRYSPRTPGLQLYSLQQCYHCPLLTPCIYSMIVAFRHLKKGYLIMYNLVQFLGFSWIFVNMTVRLFILGKGK